MQTTAAILRREFSTTEAAAQYAERIARAAEANGNNVMAHEYHEAAQQLRVNAAPRIFARNGEEL